MRIPGALEVRAEGEYEIVMTRMFQAPPSMVFEALTKPELLKRWMFGPDGWSLSVCDIDLRPGGLYRYVWKHQKGHEMGMGGKFVEISRPHRLVATERFDDPWYPGEGLTTTVLEARGAATWMTLTLKYETAEARDGVLRSPMESGMEMGYARLDAILREG